MNEKLPFRELILVGSMYLDKQETLSVPDVETAIMHYNILTLLKDKLPGFIEKTSLSMPDSDPTDFNIKLREILIGEVLESQPGRSARKWGIENNGICFLISLCTEALTDDL